MKFCKRYQEFMQQQDRPLPGVGFKNLKKLLKKCNAHHPCTNQHPACPANCTLCDGTFFPSLLDEMSAVVGCFNKRAQKLLDLHLASGFRKYISCFNQCSRRDHVDLIQEGTDLVAYALINATALRKILKKYDKIHYSKQGLAFKSQVQTMHVEILQSPWLCELMAFQINLRRTKLKLRKSPAFFEGCSIQFVDNKPSLSCELSDSVKVEVDLTCSICLDTVFDPVALSCGHIFCYMCACSAASVTIVDGLREAGPREKCALCREAGVYERAVHLEELKILLRRSCPEYWKERCQTERAERIQQAKQHWEYQCQAFIGI